MGESVRKTELHGAQHWYWLLEAVQATPGRLPLMHHVDVAVPEGLTRDALHDALTSLIARHDELRTVYGPGPDGRPVRWVHEVGELHLHTFELGRTPLPDHKTRTEADKLTLRAMSKGEYPLRALAGMRGDRVEQLILSILEIAVDGTAMTVLEEDLQEFMASGAAGRRDPCPAPDPVRELGDARPDSAGAKALAHWRKELRRGPHATLPFLWNRALHWHETPYESAFSETTLTSRDLADRCRAAARAHGVTVPSLIQAVLATILTSWTRLSSCAISSVTSNRWSEKSRPHVGRYANEVRLVVDIAGDSPFSSVVARTHHKLLLAYRHGAYDIGEFMMEEARQSLEAGARYATTVLFEYHNYREHVPVPAAAKGPADRDTHVRQRDVQYPIPNIRFEVWPKGDALEFFLKAPEKFLPKPAAKAFLEQFASLVDAVTDDPAVLVSDLTQLVSLPSPWDGPGWVRFRGAWISTEETGALLRQHPDVATAAVFLEGKHTDGPELTAYVVPGGSGDVVPDLEEHMRDLVSHHPCTFVPHRYVQCATAPSDTSDRQAWREMPVVRQGTPGTPPRSGSTAPQNHSEHVLAEAFSACHPGQETLMTATYAQLHGSFLAIPRMLAEVERRGCHGLAFGDFLGMASLRRLAGKLSADSGTP